eukprot:3796324-Karenia_brevis.AAC.1
MVILLPKPDGGRRPIGLFPTLIRVWMRMRLVVAQQWQVEHNRNFLYAGPSCGADVAAWKQAAFAEIAKSANMQYAAVLLDLVKAFDNVPFDWLVAQGVRHGYNLWLLRLSIAAYGLGRVLSIDGVCAEEVVATRGITAGSVLAVIELRVLLLSAGEALVANSIHVRLTLYVDDATIEVAGTHRIVRNETIKATEQFVHDLQRMRLTLSPTKNVVGASLPSLGKEISKGVGSINLPYKASFKSLGTGLAAG